MQPAWKMHPRISDTKLGNNQVKKKITLWYNTTLCPCREISLAAIWTWQNIKHHIHMIYLRLQQQQKMCNWCAQAEAIHKLDKWQTMYHSQKAIVQFRNLKDSVPFPELRIIHSVAISEAVEVILLNWNCKRQSLKLKNKQKPLS